MELEILRLVYDYSKNGKIVDTKFIYKLIEIVVTRRNLDHYVRDVRFLDTFEEYDDSVTVAAYSPLKRELRVYCESIKIVMEYMSRYDVLFSHMEQIMFKNLAITQFILHELGHAYQNKKMDSAEDSLEVKLLKCSFVLREALKNRKVQDALLGGEISLQDFKQIISYNKELYNRYYKLIPSERLAQVNSFNTVVNTIEDIKKCIPSLYEFEKASLLEEMLKGYEDAWSEGICPTQVYLYGTGQSHIWQGFDFYNPDTNILMENVQKQYSLAKRLSFGLPVYYQEYETSNNWLSTTNKFNV